MSAPTTRLVSSLLSALFLLVVVVGCAESTGSISGEVKVKDKVLPSGLITFVTQGKKSKTIPVEIKDGKYTVANIPVGEVLVSVTTIPKAALPPVKGAKATTQPAIPTVNVLAKYSDPKKSGLSFTVQRGENTYNPVLESDGK